MDENQSQIYIPLDETTSKSICRNFAILRKNRFLYKSGNVCHMPVLKFDLTIICVCKITSRFVGKIFIQSLNILVYQHP